MSEIRLIPASLELEFDIESNDKDGFLREFSNITQNEEDPLGAWLKRAKARGETKESDQVLLTLLIELHRKFDDLNERLSGAKKPRINLLGKAQITHIGFEYIKVSEPAFVKDECYYARILLPMFPVRTLALFLKAMNDKTCKITRLHEDDEGDWGAYVAARERVMIRQIRANS
ncbi:hypothetical protein U5B43_06480 [Campylobacter sp. 9BO]|uniref:hypothetical protein n=1 Tax=Campylobacter sp. 9BO TaxID=3424759 RepID=UPI003D343C97